MKRVKILIKSITALLLIICICLFGALIYLKNNLNADYKVLSGETLKINSYIPVTPHYLGQSRAEVKLNSSVGNNYKVKLNMFGIIPISTANVQVVSDSHVVVLGSPFGMKLYTDGVLIVALSDVDTSGGNSSPAKKCGLNIGDYIITIDGKKVYTNQDVSEIIENCNGRNINVVVNREGRILPLTLTPEISVSTGVYKAGIWVRDSSAGIGTLTFYCPYNNVICGLGHGICDKDTGSLLTVNSGVLVGAEIVSYKKAEVGNPGELNGRITLTEYGNIANNSESGVYAKTNGFNYNSNNLIKVALKQEVVNGEAIIISTINGATPKSYKCVVKKQNTGGYQNLIVEVTDQELINTTGGIVQGMSGSPIIQNGKLIGAITHVLVDNPTKGYGIFAENMLETAQSAAESNKLKEAS
ncbi:MAG: SpoIVB peptidase [Clostridia bacterium]|nr:SpoIVB peptidase [Clostridia bacterium]